MPVLSCPRCKARVEVAPEATTATCHGCGFSAPRKPTVPAAAPAPKPAPAPAPSVAAPPAATGAPAAAPPPALQRKPLAAASGPAVARVGAAPAKVAAVKKADGARVDRPPVTFAVATAVCFVLFMALAWRLSLTIIGMIVVPTLAGWLGGRYTPGDRVVRAGYAGGGAALGVVAAAILYGFFIAPFVNAALGEPPTAGLDPGPYILTMIFLYGLPSALFGFLGAFFLAEPEKGKKTAK